MTLVLTSDWHKTTMARSVPGAYFDRDEHNAWVVDEPGPRSAAVILKLFPHLGIKHPELVAMRDQLAADVRPFDNATPFGRRITAPRVQAVLDGLGWELFDYQAIDLGYVNAVLDAHGGAYLGWERGLGKTLATCCLIDALDSFSTLVVAPNTAKESVWGAELRRFCPWLTVLVMPNVKAKRERMLEEVRELHEQGRPFALVTHYESLAIVDKTHKAGGWKKLGIEWELVAADEAHRLANPKSQMSKAIKRIPSQHRVALSGSIIQNHLEEMFSPLQWLFPKTYTSRWRDWNDRYLDYVESGWGKVCVGVKTHMVEALRNELGVFMVYRRKEDELDLPERTDQELRVELSPSQRKVYDKLQADCIAQLDDGSTVVAEEGIAMMGKLRQIATGLDLVTEGAVSDSSKIDLAVEMILDSEDDDFVVFGWYKACLHALADRLQSKGIEAFLVTGDVKHSDRDEAIARFQAGEGRVFLGTLATLGESVNLQRANNVIMLDRSWNPALNAQAEDRVYRQGQKRTTTITHIIAKDTVDELNVLPTLANKQALRAAILGGV